MIEKVDTDKVTRLTVVNYSERAEFGRLLELWRVMLTFSIQDEGRTLKIFVEDRKEADNGRDSNRRLFTASQREKIIDDLGMENSNRSGHSDTANPDNKA